MEAVMGRRVMCVVGIVVYPILRASGRCDITATAVDEVAPFPCLAANEERTTDDRKE